MWQISVYRTRDSMYQAPWAESLNAYDILGTHTPWHGRHLWLPRLLSSCACMRLPFSRRPTDLAHSLPPAFSQLSLRHICDHGPGQAAKATAAATLQPD